MTFADVNTQNTFTATQYFEPPAGDDTVANAFQGRNGGFSFGIDSAATPASRDFFIGRIEQPDDDTDILYGQHNAQHTTITSAVSAGGTTLTLASALTFTGADGSGNYWVMIGDNTAGNTQEWVEITAGRGTTTLTCTALANAHPSGAAVTLGYDWENQATFEFHRVGSAYASNANWRVTIRPDVSGHQPGLGALKLEIPPNYDTTADYLEVAARDESQKAFRIQADYSVTAESVPADWSDPSASTTSGSVTLTLSSLTPTDQMYGCFVGCPGFPKGTYVTGINVGAGTLTLSHTASATASGQTAYIYKPAFQVRKNSSSNYEPYFSITDVGMTLRGKFMCGSAGTAGAGIPGADFHLAGTQIYMNGGGSYPDFAITLDTSGHALLQPWGITAISMGTSGSNPKLGFFGVSPVLQPATTGTTAGFTAGAGSAVDSAATFTGNTGSSAYTIGDIVAAMKTLGLIAS